MAKNTHGLVPDTKGPPLEQKWPRVPSGPKQVGEVVQLTTAEINSLSARRAESTAAPTSTQNLTTFTISLGRRNLIGDYPAPQATLPRSGPGEAGLP